MKQQNAGLHKVPVTEPNISTKEQVDAQPIKVVNGMKFVSIENETERYYDMPSRQVGKTIRVVIKDPQWLFVRESGSHTVIAGDGYTHYIPNDFVHLAWKKKEGTDAAEF